MKKVNKGEKLSISTAEEGRGNFLHYKYFGVVGVKVFLFHFSTQYTFNEFLITKERRTVRFGMASVAKFDLTFLEGRCQG